MRKFALMALTATALPLLAAAPALAQQNNMQPQNQSQQPLNQQSQGQAQQSPDQNQTASENLSQGEIRQMQQALDQKGFKSGRADGKLGPETKKALNEFQQKQGLQQTGMPDQQTLAALGINNNEESTTGQAPNEQQNGASQNQNQNLSNAPQNQPAQNQPAPSKSSK